MLRSALFALTFILNLRFKQISNFPYHILSTYGEDGARTLRNYLNTLKKLEKSKLDLDFLIKCKTYGVLPRFLRFKLYKRSLQQTKFYKSWQNKLLNKEINFKRSSVRRLDCELQALYSDVRLRFSYIDGALVSRFCNRENEAFRNKTLATHHKKLSDLGVNSEIRPCDPNRVVQNYSSISLSPRLRTILAYGLDFCLPVYKVDFYKYFLFFEKLAFSLKHCSAIENSAELLNCIQSTAFKYFYNFKSSKVFSSVFTRDDIAELKKLGRNNDVVVCKPDKGSGVVIVDRSVYVQSMTSIISDPTKFIPIDIPVSKYTMKVEDKINYLLRKLKNLKMLSEDVYNSLRVSGSGPGILYGLPKTHKVDFSSKFQFRPIFAAYNTPSFNIAKYFVPILNPLTKNNFTVENSNKFAESVVGLKDADSYIMASFDVESLFTNIPLRETIEICLNSLFTDPVAIVSGFTRECFKSLLEMSVLNSFFLFDGKVYQQTEGLGMGLPLGPTFANIFMCFHEKTWLENCPEAFKPTFYRRYVDDTFLLFKSRDQAQLFLNYLNSKHPNIRFTIELENDGCLSFLDCKVYRQNNCFNTSVYRKETFTGLGTSFFSFCTFRFKINSLKTLLHRGYRISSNFINMHTEFEFLKNFFLDNGFPLGLIQSHINSFLNNVFQPKVPTIDCNAYTSELFFKVPYFGHQSEKLRKDLLQLLSKFYPTVKFTFILVNSFKIGSFFSYKDRLPLALRSSLVYKFSCAHCASAYVGSTVRALGMRVEEHAGRSLRTGNSLKVPSQSSIRDHCEECNSPIILDRFSVLGTAQSTIDVRILESLHIFKSKPVLNDTQSAYPLQILNR